MRLHVRAAGLLFVLGTSLAGCDENLSDLTGPTPNLQPTLSSIQQEIFNTTDSSGRQACTNCHTDAGRAPAGGMNLRSGMAYASLVGTGSVGKPGATRVVPGDPVNSYLIHKLEGRADIVGTRMPRGNTLLTEGQLLVIKRWIELGARND
jgi:hypothetical protein